MNKATSYETDRTMPVRQGHDSMRELSVAETGVVAGRGPGIGACQKPSGNDHHFIAMMKWAGWSDARIARAFYTW